MSAKVFVSLFLFRIIGASKSAIKSASPNCPLIPKNFLASIDSLSTFP